MAEWESWFVDVTETHTSLPALAFFRSPHWEHSWAPASGAVLDGASLPASTVDRSRGAELCIRAGYVALRRIADFFDIWHNPDPHWPEEPISIDRREFDRSAGSWPRPGATRGRPGPGLARLRRSRA